MQKTAPQKKERQSNIELLRILCMFLIVFHHYSIQTRGLYPSNEASFGRFFVYVMSLVGPLGDNLFVLITGYFLVNAKFKLRRVARIWAEVFFYAVIVSCIGMIARPPQGGVGLRDVFRAIAPVTSTAYWFVTAYMMLALLSPFLNKLIHALTRKELLTLNALLLVLVSALPTFIQGFVGWSRVATFILLYCMAAYVRLYPDSVPLLNTRRRCFALGLGVMGLLVLFVAACVLLGTRFVRFRYYISFFLDIYDLPQVLMSLGLFMGFLRLNIRPNRLINTVASAAFGVYLIHDNEYMRDLLWKGIAHVESLVGSPWLVLHGLCWSALVYVVCTGIDLLRQRYAEPLYMRLIDRLPPIRRELEQEKAPRA